MRNLRKVVALVLAFALVLSMGTVSFAADMTAAQKAETLGVLKGDGTGVTAEYLAKTPTRLQAAILSLRLRGLEAEALAYEGTEKFDDADDIAWAGGKAIAAYLKANPALGWIGDGKTFMPNEPISAQAYVKVMLEALGYKQGTDFEWAEVFTFAASKGLDDLKADTKMTNDALAVGSMEALAANNKDGKKLVDVLVADGKIDKTKAQTVGLVAAEAMKFEYVSVEGFGLKAVKVMFASDVDTFTIDSVKNATIAQSGSPAKDVIAIDGKEVVVIFKDAVAQNKEVTLQFDAKGKDGVEIKDKEVKVTLADKVDPKLVSVTVENAKTIKVKYDEPIVYTEGSRVFDSVKIDDGKLVGKATLSKDLTEITFLLNTKLAANSYVFTMESVKDFAGFTSPSEAKTITVVADDAAPKLVEVKVTDKNNIVLVFDENVAKIGGVDLGTVTAPDGTSKEVKVALTKALVASDAFVAVASEYDEVEDVIGNKSAKDVKFSFKAPFDEAAPTATVTVNKDGDIIVKFSEVVEGFTASAITLTKIKDNGDAGDAIAFTGPTYDTKEKEYKIDITDNAVDPIDYKLTIKDTVKDASVIGNKFTKTEYTVTMPDKKAPTITGVAVVGTDKVRISFSEKMNEATLENLANYIVSVSGAAATSLATITDAKAEAGSDLKTVDLTAKGFKAGDSVAVLNVKDANDTLLKATTDYNVTKSVVAAQAFKMANLTFTLKSVNTIEVVSTTLEFANPNEFTIAAANEFILFEGTATEQKNVYVTSAVVDSKDAKKVTLTLSKDLKTDVTTDGSTAIKIGIKGKDTKDKFGVVLTGAAMTVADKVAPTAKISGTTKTAFDIEFSEAVTATPGELANDIIIKDKDGKALIVGTDINALSVSGSKVTISGTAIKADTKYTVVVQSRYIKDANGNATKGLAATEVTTKK